MPYTTIPEGSSAPDHTQSAQSSKLKSSTKPSEASATKPVYFWRPKQGNGYLSQWYWSKFTTTDGSTYATAEMYMMVAKARLFGDEETAQKMLATTDPGRHKALGREVKNFDAKSWDDKKSEIVEMGNWYKFTISENAGELKRRLLETGERELVEASPADRIWGIGFTEHEAEKNRYRWGENLLGKALERVRERLREEEGGKKE
jgi:ribA/ribD-fused uncharacterized protein